MPACNLSWVACATTRSHGQKRSRTASGGHAAFANEFVALSVQARPQPPARGNGAAMKSGDRGLKRAARAFNFLSSRKLVLGRF